jgi:hypothetical protein
MLRVQCYISRRPVLNPVLGRIRGRRVHAQDVICQGNSTSPRSAARTASSRYVVGLYEHLACTATLVDEKEQIAAQQISTEPALHEPEQTVVALAEIDRLRVREHATARLVPRITRAPGGREPRRRA